MNIMKTQLYIYKSSKLFSSQKLFIVSSRLYWLFCAFVKDIKQYGIILLQIYHLPFLKIHVFCNCLILILFAIHFEEEKTLSFLGTWLSCVIIIDDLICWFIK